MPWLFTEVYSFFLVVSSLHIYGLVYISLCTIRVLPDHIGDAAVMPWELSQN